MWRGGFQAEQALELSYSMAERGRRAKGRTWAERPPPFASPTGDSPLVSGMRGPTSQPCPARAGKAFQAQPVRFQSLEEAPGNAAVDSLRLCLHFFHRWVFRLERTCGRSGRAADVSVVPRAVPAALCSSAPAVCSHGYVTGQIGTFIVKTKRACDVFALDFSLWRAF